MNVELDKEGTQQEEVQPEVDTNSEEQAVKAVSSLLGEPQEERQQEDSEPEEKSEEKEEAQESEQQGDPFILDDELVNTFPTLKSLKGKQVKDLAKSYDELARRFNKTNQELIKIKQQQSAKKFDELGDAPDMIDEPEQFKEWLKKRDDYVRQSALSEQNEAEARQREYIEQINNAISQGLPQTANPQEVILDWMNDNAYEWYDEVGNINAETQRYYANNPQIFVNRVIKHYETMATRQKLSKSQKEQEKEAKLNAHKIAQKTFQNARQTRNQETDVNLIQRSEDLSEADKLIYEIWENLPKGD